MRKHYLTLYDVFFHQNFYSVYVFELDQDGEEAEYMDDNDEEEGHSAASHHWLLPSRSFHGMWDSLIFESDMKCKVVQVINQQILMKN